MESLLWAGARWMNGCGIGFGRSSLSTGGGKLSLLVAEQHGRPQPGADHCLFRETWRAPALM